MPTKSTTQKSPMSNPAAHPGKEVTHTSSGKSGSGHKSGKR
jgi:hypothetical protein